MLILFFGQFFPLLIFPREDSQKLPLGHNHPQAIKYQKVKRKILKNLHHKPTFPPNTNAKKEMSLGILVTAQRPVSAFSSTKKRKEIAEEFQK